MSANTKCCPQAETLATPEGMSIWMGTCDISVWVMTFGLVCSASVEWEMWRYRVTGENLTVWGQCLFWGHRTPSSYQIQPLCPLSGPSLKETDTQEPGISFLGQFPVPLSVAPSGGVGVKHRLKEWSSISLTLILPLTTSWQLMCRDDWTQSQ